MASKKARKAVKVVRTKRGGKSRARPLVILVLAAVAAAVVYQYMSPSGAFKPVPAASKSSVKKTPATKAVTPVKKAPVESRAEEKKAEPVREEPKPAEPPQPVCNAINLSLFDIQRMASNPSYRFVDTRAADRFAAGSIPGAVNIPVADFENSFAAAAANLSTGAGIILFGEDSMDESPRQVCILMTGRVSPHIYMFREGWGRWVPQQ